MSTNKKPLVSGPDALFHFWPFPTGPAGLALPDVDRPNLLERPSEGAAEERGDAADEREEVQAGGAGEKEQIPEQIQEEDEAEDAGDEHAEDNEGREEKEERQEVQAARVEVDEARPAPVKPAQEPSEDDGWSASDAEERVLITGISGGQGRLVARRLGGRFDVVGVDRIPWEGHPSHVRMHVFDLRRRRFEDVFRTERPTSVVHLAFVRHFGGDPELRHEVNVLGTRQLLEHCVQYGVKRLVVLSSAYVYGALPENPFYLTEDAPLNVSRTYPEVRDLAEVDTICSAFLWRYPQIKTTILRPVNTLGYYVHSAVGRYLGLNRVPMILGFDPMTQFIHEEDVAEAIALAIEKEVHGVFNVSGPSAVPLSVAIRESGSRPVAIPDGLARWLLGNLFRFGLYPFPPGAIDFVKYPCTVDGRSFREATGFRPLFNLREIFTSVQSRSR